MIRVNNSSRHCDPTWDAWCAVLVKAIKQAVSDARGGDLQAAAWLDEQCPGWRERRGVKRKCPEMSRFQRNSGRR